MYQFYFYSNVLWLYTLLEILNAIYNLNEEFKNYKKKLQQENDKRTSS